MPSYKGGSRGDGGSMGAGRGLGPGCGTPLRACDGAELLSRTPNMFPTCMLSHIENTLCSSMCVKVFLLYSTCGLCPP